MAQRAASQSSSLTTNGDYAVGLARAFGGAVLFGLPLLMTMEMWSLGFYAHPARLLIFLVVNAAILIGLSRFGGFERTDSLFEDVLDALAAVAVAVLTSAMILSLLGIVTAEMKLDEIVGKIAIQSIPCSFGAMLARKQLGGGGGRDAEAEAAERGAGYAGQLFLMAAGALFLAFNMAPTEEMLLIEVLMSPWHTLLLVLLSILMLDAFVYMIGFPGQQERRGDAHRVATFLHYSLVGYGIAILISAYVLWTFGRTDGAELSQMAFTVAVLAFPAAIGAAIARLVI
jgi:putative integral membrane protein (TIGR02587 family)